MPFPKRCPRVAAAGLVTLIGLVMVAAAGCGPRVELPDGVMEAIGAEFARRSEPGETFAVRGVLAAYPYEAGHLVLIRGRWHRQSGWGAAYVWPVGPGAYRAEVNGFDPPRRGAPADWNFVRFRGPDAKEWLVVYGRRLSSRVVRIRITVSVDGEEQEVIFPIDDGYFFRVFRGDRVWNFAIQGLDRNGKRIDLLGGF